MSDDFTTHQIEGVCEGVMMKGDWQEFHIGIGKQYPVKLSTKQEDIKALAAAAGAQRAVWTYQERQGGPNPHRPGEFFKNRYLSNVEVGGTIDPALAAPAAASGGTGQASSGSGRSTSTDRSIERQVIIKSAMYLYPAGLITSDEEWFALIHKLDDFMVKTTTAAPPAAAEPSDGQAALPGTTSVVNPDDDIPF